MDGDVPSCDKMPLMKSQEVNFLAFWHMREDVEYLVLVLLAQFLQFKYNLYTTDIGPPYIVNPASHVTPLRKYPPLIAVSSHFYLQRQRRSMSPNSCCCCCSSSWGDEVQKMTIFDHLKQWIIDKSLKETHWGHFIDPLTSEVIWGRLEAAAAIQRPLKPFRDHGGHSDNHLTLEVTWGHLEATEAI